MNKENEVLKNTLILMIGSFLPRILNLLTTPLITGFVETGGIGIIGFLTTTILTFVVPVGTLQLEQAFFRFLLIAKDKKEKDIIISSGFMIIVAIIILLGVVTCCIPIAGFTGKYKLLLITYIGIEVIAQIFRFILRAFTMYKEYSLAAIIAVIVNIITLLICLLVFKMGYIGVFISLLVADTISVIYILIVSPIASHIKISCYRSTMAKKMIVYALPFIPNMLAYSVNSVSDRFFIKGFLGNNANGIYDIAYKVPNIISIVYPAFNLAWTESALSNAKDESRDMYYTRMFQMMFKIVTGGAISLMAVSPYIFKIIVSQKASLVSALHYVPLLIISLYFLCFAQFFSGIYIAENESKHMTITTCVAAVVNIIILLLLIHFIKIQAAVIASCISNLVLAIYRYYDINKRFYRMKVNKKLVAVSAVMFTIQLCLFWRYDTVLNIINILLSLLFAYVICGDVIRDLFTSIIYNRKKA